MDQTQNYFGIVANPYGNKGSQLLNAGVPLNTTIPSVPNSVNATDIVSSKALNAPTSNNSNFLNELLAGYQSNLNSLQNQQQTATTSIQDLMSQLVGQTGDRITAENQAGLPQLNTQLRDLQTLSQRQLASYAQNTLNNDINAQGVTRTAQEGNQAFITRQYGIDSLITNANISAISGQIQTAQAQVDRAMSLKYDPIKQVIENQKFILDQVNTKEARAASDVKDFQLRILDKEQQNEKDINNIAIEAAKNGAPASVLAGIRNAKTVNEALTKTAGFMSDPLAKQIQKAQLDKLNAETSKILNDIKIDAIKNSPQAAGELKSQALTTAKEMAQQLLSGTASGAIGAKGISSLFGLKGKPIAGTDAANFTNLYDNFKALLSLDNVKLLKGQGQISDSERKILEDASSKLSRNTSEAEFRKILYTTITALGGDLSEIDPYASIIQSLPSGEILVKDKVTGQVGSIPSGEYSGLRYEKL